jgi:hypothetical protein
MYVLVVWQVGLPVSFTTSPFEKINIRLELYISYGLYWIDTNHDCSRLTDFSIDPIRQTSSKSCRQLRGVTCRGVHRFYLTILRLFSTLYAKNTQTLYTIRRFWMIIPCVDHNCRSNCLEALDTRFPVSLKAWMNVQGLCAVLSYTGTSHMGDGLIPRSGSPTKCVRIHSFGINSEQEQASAPSS